jgi:hypothetical protein
MDCQVIGVGYVLQWTMKKRVDLEGNWFTRGNNIEKFWSSIMQKYI